MSDREKYIVFKREDWNEVLPSIRMFDLADLKPLDDAVVIRTQDVFAAAGLSAYWHIISAYCELHVRETGQDITQGVAAARDYIKEVAEEAEDRLARGECRLPD